MTRHSDNENQEQLSEVTEKALERASLCFNKWLTYGQALALIAVAIATLVGIISSIWEMAASSSVSLGALLMLFLYVEIISMVKASAMGTRELPIRTPIALAIVAVARYIVIDVEHISAAFMLMTAGSILLLVLALWLSGRVRSNI